MHYRSASSFEEEWPVTNKRKIEELSRMTNKRDLEILLTLRKYRYMTTH